MRVLDLFSGIGGFSLGLERAGMRTVAFCEVDPFCRAVLAQHWPEVPIYDDVRSLTADALRRDGIAVDLIAGGFPCQDISLAGKRAGLEGARSGLWSEFARLIGELRPEFAIVENVPGLLGLGMGDVLGDLAALGYDAVWDCIPASAVGAPHRRDRVWIVAYRDGQRQSERREPDERSQQSAKQTSRRRDARGLCPHVADADEQPRHQRRAGDAAEVARGGNADRGCQFGDVRDAHVARLAIGQGERGDPCEERAPAVRADWWAAEPDVGRVANGVPNRVDRLRALGNAVVPQIPEMIGRAIMEAIN